MQMIVNSFLIVQMLIVLHPKAGAIQIIPESLYSRVVRL